MAADPRPPQDKSKRESDRIPSRIDTFEWAMWPIGGGVFFVLMALLVEETPDWFALVGGLFIGIGIIIIVFETRRIRSYEFDNPVSTQGVITKKDMYRIGDYQPEEVYTIYFRYLEQYDGSMVIPKGWYEQLKIGDKIDVEYLPSDPQKYRVV